MMGNSIVLGVAKPQSLANSGISDGYIANFPCLQATSDASLVDRSGRGVVGTFSAGLTPSEAWTTLGNYLSTLETTTPDDVSIPLAAMTYNWNAGDSFVLACRVRAAAPATTRSLFGNGYHSTNAQGLRIIVKATGIVAPWFYQSTGDKFNSDSSIVLADGATHSYMFALFDHNVSAGTLKYMQWIDGVRAYAVETVATGLGTMTPVDGFRIGGNKTGASTYQSMAASFQGIDILRSAATKLWTYELLDAIAMRKHRAPLSPLTALEFPSA